MSGARELSSDERALLRLLCGGTSVPGALQLRAQVEAARVSGGLPTLLDLDVPATVERAPVEDGPLPQRAFVTGSRGEMEGELLVWVRDGYLSSLEFAWYTDTTPSGMPTLERVQIQ